MGEKCIADHGFVVGKVIMREIMKDLSFPNPGTKIHNTRVGTGPDRNSVRPSVRLSDPSSKQCKWCSIYSERRNTSSCTSLTRTARSRKENMLLVRHEALTVIRSFALSLHRYPFCPARGNSRTANNVAERSFLSARLL